MTYLERYTNGEYEQVWRELSSLGSGVFQDHVHNDALEVARETMRRVRKNTELLLERLMDIGFLFGYNHRIQPNTRGYTSFQKQKEYLAMFSWVQKQPPAFLSAKLLQETINDVKAQEALYSGMDLQKDIFEKWDNVWSPGGPWPYDMVHYIEEIERFIGPVPLSVRAWYEEVGGVNFYGYHPQWNTLYQSLHSRHTRAKISTLMSGCDPLQVHPLDEICMSQIRQQHKIGKFYGFEFAEDPSFKDFCSGSSTPYIFLLPNAIADPSLRGLPLTFVQYLRMSFSWAGFPGMASWAEFPREDLAFLTHDLHPF